MSFGSVDSLHRIPNMDPCSEAYHCDISHPVLIAYIIIEYIHVHTCAVTVADPCRLTIELVLCASSRCKGLLQTFCGCIDILHQRQSGTGRHGNCGGPRVLRNKLPTASQYACRQTSATNTAVDTMCLSVQEEQHALDDKARPRLADTHVP